MRAVLTAVIAAIEACAVALAGIVLVAVPALLLWWLAGRGEYAYLGSVSYSAWWVFLTAPLAGIYANVVVARRLKANRVLELLGRQSFTIMALHFLAFKAVILLQMLFIPGDTDRLASFPVWSGSDGWWLVSSLFGLALPVAAGLAAAKVRAFAVMRFRPTRDGAEW